MKKQHFYTSVVQYKNQFLFRGYLDGKRAVYKDRGFKPFLFINSDDEDSEFRTLAGKPVEKMVFDSTWDAKQFMQQYDNLPGFPIYGMSNWVYPYIYENFGINIPHDASLVTVANIDIETMADGGFPRPELADKEVTAITVRVRGTAYVFGNKDYNPQKIRDLGLEPAKNVKYKNCGNEATLLATFLRFWQALDPDIVTGWNINGFDIPYLLNRISKILSEDDSCKMSPWNMVEWKEIEVMGRIQNFATLVGITILDYLEMYRKFCPGSRESFKLDYIGKYEGCETVKFDYGALGYKSLHDLYTRNYDLYIHYNILDTEVVDNLEAKLKLIQLVIVMAYNSGLNYIDAMTTVRLWDVTIHGYLMSKGIVIPQTKRMGADYGGIEGAYVKEPIVGLSKWVCSFDVNSLYPSLIRQCNISPETYVTTVSSVTVAGLLNLDDHHSVVEKNLHREEGPTVAPDVSPEILKRLKGAGASLCATGCIFDNEVQGFYPYLMEYYYGERTKYKGLMKDAKNQLKALKEIKGSQADIEKLERDIATYDMFQYSFKIMLNSAYGALSNSAYRWYDPKLSESVTKTGQMTIRWVERDINLELNKMLGSEGEKFVIYCDTDSAYVRLEKLVEKMWPDLEDKDIVDKVDAFCKETIEPIIEKSFKRLTEMFNHRENVLVMKREAIASKGIWTAKKRYMLNVWDMEGFRYSEPSLKIQGIECVKSSTPRAARDIIKDGIKVIMNGTEQEFIRFVADKRLAYHEMGFEEIAFPRSCNNLKKYTSTATIYQKGCPIHVRAALVFNHYVQHMGLTDTIQLIEEGEKIKMCPMIRGNPTGENVIATTGELPKSLELDDYIDRRTAFDKGVLEPIKTICNAIGWQPEYVPTLNGLFY